VRATPTRLPEVLLLEADRYGDARGFFCESYNRREFARATGLDPEFVQDNHSHSTRGTLRGLHYQLVHPQGKLIRAMSGRILDVAVDLRRSSPRFARWVTVELDGENERQLWIPPGFAHGFLVLSEVVDVCYKTTEYWDRDSDQSLRWNDPTLAIPWPEVAFPGGEPRLSDKDRRAPLLDAAPLFD
jgi:dTDP-4-dehydrorhamnose 3,5-epimerase